jgi:hypothetical protein
MSRELQNMRDCQECYGCPDGCECECHEALDFYDGLSGRWLGSMPSVECARDCSTPGQDASESVAHWLPQVTWTENPQYLRDNLRECGAWDDLDTVDLDTLKSRTLWLAANDWREENAR